MDDSGATVEALVVTGATVVNNRYSSLVVTGTTTVIAVTEMVLTGDTVVNDGTELVDTGKNNPNPNPNPNPIDNVTDHPVRGIKKFCPIIFTQKLFLPKNYFYY